MKHLILRKNKELIQASIRNEITKQLINLYENELEDIINSRFGNDWIKNHNFKNGKLIHVEGNSESSVTLYINDDTYPKYSDDTLLLHWHKNDLFYQISRHARDIMDMTDKIVSMYGEEMDNA